VLGELTGRLADRQQTLALDAQREDQSIPFALSLVEGSAAADLLASQASYLHPREVETLSGYRSPQRQSNFALGRWVAKQALLALVPGLKAPEIEIAAGVFGQPCIRGIPSPPALSLTHTHRGAIAIATDPGHIVGVDLESLAVRHDETFLRSLTSREQQLLGGVSPPSTARAGLAWTLKEALSKALRCGFTAPLPVFELKSFDSQGDGGFRALFENFAQYQGRAWQLGAGAFAIVLPKNTSLDLSATAKDAITRLCSG
jgi:4'-phosphopantetheinyl transferase